MKKFNYLLLFAFWSFGNFANGQCGKNKVAVVNTQFKEIYEQYLLVFDAYKNDNGVKMSTTVGPFFKKYRPTNQATNSTTCLDKQELTKCLSDFQVILKQAENLQKKSIQGEVDGLQVLKTIIDELKELEVSTSQSDTETPSNELSTQKSEESARAGDGKDGNSEKKNSIDWPWFVAIFFGLITLVLGFWLWKLLDKQNYINLTLKHLSDKLDNLLGNSGSTDQPNSDENQLERIDTLIRTLVNRYSIFSRDKQEIERLMQNIERYKKNEKALLDQKEAISSEFENYKITVAKSMSNKTSVVTDKSGTFLQNSEQTSLQPNKLFYLSYASPSNDGMGEFYDKRQQQPNSANSYYRFEMEPDEVNAKFWFHDTAGTVEGATRNPDTYLSPACEYAAVDPKAKHILTKKEGVAKRTGDVWKVYRKAVIEFS